MADTQKTTCTDPKTETHQQQQQSTSKKSQAAKKSQTPKKALSSSSSSSKKAEAVLTEKEIGRMIDLGIGRGVDATDPKPWANKSSFQVRSVTIENVIGTEEGGSLQSYEREITSVQTNQTDLKASVAVPQAPVNIGVDAEQSRSFSTTRRAVGKKVINRTISFRADFEDVPQSRTTDPTKARLEASVAVSAERSDSVDSESESDRNVADMQSGITFEERLAGWIINRVKGREDLDELQLLSEGKPLPKRFSDHITGDPLTDIAYVIQNGSDEDRKAIVRDCREFVYHFRITHYVSAIELGAAEYRVLSESEYYAQIGASGSLGIESLANFAISEKASWKKTKKASDVKKIGRVTTDDKVTRGSYDEAVVGVSIQPISSLVRLRYLQLALRKAILNYVDEQGDTSSGPFLVSFHNDTMFWSVNSDRDYAVEATSNIRNASLFYVIPNDDGENPYEFVLGYLGDNRKLLKRVTSTLTPSSKTQVQGLYRYLNARVNISGGNPGPLHLQHHITESHSRLTLQNRLMKKSKPVDTTAWVQGREAFFISCARRRLKRDGYICVKAIQTRGQVKFITACVPSTSFHNDRNTWMLFRLLPGSYRENPGALTTNTDEVDKSDRAVGKDILYLGPSKRTAPSGDKTTHEHGAVGSDRSTSAIEPGDTNDTSRLLASQRHIDTSGVTFPPTGAEVPLSELGNHQITDPTKTEITTSVI